MNMGQGDVMTTLCTTFNALQTSRDTCVSGLAQRTDIADESLTAVAVALRRMDLLADGQVPLLTILRGSNSSELYRAELGWGIVCVKRALPMLRRASICAPTQRNHTESEWLKLARAVVGESVPEVLGECNGMFAMDYLDPNRHTSWQVLLRDGEITPSAAAEVGRLIGRVHAATAHNLAVGRRFDADESFYVQRIEPLVIATAQAQPALATRLKQSALSLRRNKIALMHGELIPENVHIGPKGPVLIDAECASYGDPAFDVASLLAHLLMMSVWRPHWRDRYLICFDAFCAAYAQRISWEIPEQIDERAALLVPVVLLGSVLGSLPTQFLYGPRERDLVAGLARRLLVDPVVRLAAVRESWRRYLWN
jgi:aminoglycoside phosphotransferase (APT) family kinase protein